MGKLRKVVWKFRKSPVKIRKGSPVKIKKNCLKIRKEKLHIYIQGGHRETYGESINKIRKVKEKVRKTSRGNLGKLAQENLVKRHQEN